MGMLSPNVLRKAAKLFRVLSDQTDGEQPRFGVEWDYRLNRHGFWPGSLKIKISSPSVCADK
jgi:hypothetical protein